MVGLGHRKQNDFRQQAGGARQRRRTGHHAPENGKLDQKNLNSTGGRRSAGRRTPETPKQSMDVPIPENRGNVPPGFGSQHPQEDFEGCRAGTPEISRLETHIRNVGAPERRGRENGIQYARPFRRGLYTEDIHPRHTADAGKRSRKDGQFHGAGHVNTQPKNKERRRG